MDEAVALTAVQARWTQWEKAVVSNNQGPRLILPLRPDEEHELAVGGSEASAVLVDALTAGTRLRRPRRRPRPAASLVEGLTATSRLRCRRPAEVLLIIHMQVSRCSNAPCHLSSPKPSRCSNAPCHLSSPKPNRSLRAKMFMYSFRSI